MSSPMLGKKEQENIKVLSKLMSKFCYTIFYLTREIPVI